MNINYKQPQFELFPANSATLEDINKPRFLLANLTLSLETLVILSILVIMVGLFSFAVGVERGKQMVAQALDEKVNVAWNVSSHNITAATNLTVIKPIGNAGFITKTSVAQIKPAIVPMLKPVARPVQKALSLPTVKTVPVGGNLTVQVATYKNESFAQKEAMDLKAKGYPTFLIKKGNFWLVCAGHFASLDQANTYLKRLQAKYRGSQVRRF